MSDRLKLNEGDLERIVEILNRHDAGDLGLQGVAEEIFAAFGDPQHAVELQWRSMKSAPKDGRFVLIFDSDYPTVEPIIARYRHGDWWSQPTAAGHSIVWRHATHWMALPPPPGRHQPWRGELAC